MTQPMNGRTRIFISYRRDDARGASGRLYDWLRIAFGREQVFRDVASIGAGKWRLKIDQALTASAVCLPVIGLRWCDATNGPRLADEHDMVRHELVTALAHSAQGLTIILTLVEGAKVPKKADLPTELHELVEWNAYPLSEEGWEDDVRRLIGAAAECTGQAPAADVDTLITRVGEAEARMRAMEQEKHLQTDQIRALTGTVVALTGQLAERPASQRAELTAALEALGRGDTAGAEAEFERVLEERSVAAEAAAQEAAEAARHIANLALLNDIGKAVRYYRRACELVPGNANGWRLLGQAYIVVGNTNQAREALTRALTEVERGTDRWEHMVAVTILGDLALRTEHLGEALEWYTAARNIVVEEAARDPANTEWQRDLSVSHNKIGDVLVAQGDGPGALTAYRKGLAIREALAARDPANTQWQRDLSVSHDRIGDVLVAQGDGPGALTAYRTGLAIRETLAKRDPGNTQWQRDLSVSHERIGDVLVAQGDLPGALTAYRTGLAIRETLARRDPANTQWQYDLGISNERIGAVLVAQGDLNGAMAAYRKKNSIVESLAARDPANTQWQRDLSVSHDRIGDVLVAQGDGPGALTAYRKGLAIGEALAARDPANTQWQNDVAVSCAKLGTHAGITADERRSYLQRGLKIQQNLKTSGRLAPNQDWIGWFTERLNEIK